MRRAVAALALVSALAGACAADLPSLVADSGLSASAVVRLSASEAVAARGTASGTEVLSFRDAGDGWYRQVIASTDSTAPALVQMVTMGGDTREEWNTFVYGRAEPGVSRVMLEGLSGIGGQVVDGVWVVALRQRDLQPADLRWVFLSADGAVLLRGTGIAG